MTDRATPPGIVPVNDLPARGAPSRDLPAPASALAIGAHPDDIEFGCGATLAKWAAAGTVLHHLVLTDGSKGSWDPHQDESTLIALRKEDATLRRALDWALARLAARGIYSELYLKNFPVGFY